MSTTGGEHDGIRILSLGMSFLLGSQLSAIHLYNLTQIVEDPELTRNYSY